MAPAPVPAVGAAKWLAVMSPEMLRTARVKPPQPTQTVLAELLKLPVTLTLPAPVASAGNEPTPESVTVPAADENGYFSRLPPAIPPLNVVLKSPSTITEPVTCCARVKSPPTAL